MKKIVGIISITLLLCACGENIEHKADQKLAEAKTSFKQGNYNEAKLKIDSIKILYPKAFKARQAGIDLMLEVELKEQRTSLVYLDSLRKVLQDKRSAIIGKYILEKDTAYQRVGNYFWPSQTMDKNAHRSYIRFQVSEDGITSMTSIYRGSSFIHHTAVCVTAPDGTFAQTPTSKDIYETSILGEKTENTEYKNGNDGNVMGFIYLNQDKNIRVKFIGNRDYNTTMSPADKQALKGIYELSQILAGINKVKEEQDEANLKIKFVTKRMEQKTEQSQKKDGV
ncbi:MAG: hypothetical protein WCR45_10100 [Bacteroidaceae bacterium]|nr:hypothetical protein [Bacteroidaceae bacterium]